MARILHLLDLHCDAATRAAQRAIAARGQIGQAQQTATLGHGGNFRNTAQAILQLRRRRRSFDWDLIHTWGERAFVAAALGQSAAIVHSPGGAMDRGHCRWVVSAMSYRAIELVVASSTIQRRCAQRGIDPDRCHVVRHGVDFSTVRSRRDPGLRAALGFNDHDIVILAVGESTVPAAHAQALWATAILHVLDPRYKLLIWGRGPRSGALQRFARGMRLPEVLTLAEQRLGREMAFESLPSAADAIVATGDDDAPALPVAIAMAAALPIIATVHSTVSELLEDRHTAWMVAPGSPRLLAQRILDALSDPSAQWRICDTARAECYEHFSLTRFLDAMRGVYQKALETSAASASTAQLAT